MIELSGTHICRLEERVAGGARLEVALPTCVGSTVVGGGLWRFFSDAFPPGGVYRWNESSGWRMHWKPFLPHGLFSFGEDIFGNQLVILVGRENMYLWDHEQGALADLLVAPAELMSTIVESGMDWIDAYANGSLEVARQHGWVPIDSHLHWTTPLILGGAVSLENLTVVERESHLVGHAKLWLQVQRLEPGSAVQPTTPSSPSG